MTRREGGWRRRAIGGAAGQPLDAQRMGEFLQVEGVAQRSAPHHLTASGQVQILGEEPGDLASGQPVDGHQRNDQPLQGAGGCNAASTSVERHRSR